MRHRFFRYVLPVVVFLLVGTATHFGQRAGVLPTPQFSFSESFTQLSLQPQTLAEKTPAPAQESESSAQILGESQGSMHFRSDIQAYSGYSNGGVLALSASAPPEVYLSTYQVRGDVSVKVYRVTQADIFGHLLHSPEGKRFSGVFEPESSQLVSEFTHRISNEVDPLTLPLEGSGYWYVAAAHDRGATAGTFLVRSTVGAVVKEGNGKFIFWVQDFASGKSVEGASIQTVGLESQVNTLDSNQTNADGIVELSYTPAADLAVVSSAGSEAIVPINLQYFYGDEVPTWFQFEEQLKQMKRFTFTDRPIYQPGDVVYFKSILREDDDNRYAVVGGSATVAIYSSWEEDSKLFEQTYSISEYGSIDGSFTLPEDAPAESYYRVKIQINSDQDQGEYSRYRTDANFAVSFYRKPDYFLDAAVVRQEYVAQDTVEYEVSGEYFSGQPLSFGQAEYRVTASEYHDWGYYQQSRLLDDEYRYWSGYGDSIASGTVELDEQGKAKISVPSPASRGLKDRVFSLEMEYTDSTGNPAFVRKNVLVRAAEYGMYQNGQYQYTSRRGGRVEIPLKLVRREDSSLIQNVELQVSPTVTRWIPEPLTGKYRTYRKEEQKLDDFSVVTNADGEAVLSIAADNLGSHELVVVGKDSRGNEVGRTFHFYVIDENEPLYSDQSARAPDIGIRAEREEYQPDETAKLSVSSLSPDRDLFLTVERGRVDRYQVVRMSGKSATVDLALQEADMPNQFVTISSFSPLSYHTAQTNLTVSAQRRQMQVTLTPDREMYGPGDTVTIQVKATDGFGSPVQGEVAVWSVDKALFELVKNGGVGNIFETFWSKRWDSTEESHSLKGISSSSAEGGGCFAGSTPITLADGSQKPIQDITVGEQVLTRASGSTELVPAAVTAVHETQVEGVMIVNQSLQVTPEHVLWLNDEWQPAANMQIGDYLRNSQNEQVFVESLEWVRGSLPVYNLTVQDQETYFAGDVFVHNQKGEPRQIFKDTAYWNPSVRTDANGTATIRYTLPDNLTTWVVTGVGATSNTTVGQGETEIKVAKEVVVRPVLPEFLRTGDKLAVGAMVHNFTDTERTFKVSFDATGSEILDELERTVSIPPSQFEELQWNITVEDETDGKFTFTAQALDDESVQDGVELLVPVVPYGFTRTRSEAQSGPASYSLDLVPDADLSKSDVTLSLSPTLVGTLPSAMQYLLNYPYGCVEQTTSRLVPAVVALQHPELFREALADRDAREMVEKGIERLRFLQLSAGGWSWWHSSDPDPFVTAYAYEHLLLARDAGVEVPVEMLYSARIWFESEEFWNASDLQEKKVIAAYVRTLEGSESSDLLSFEGLKTDVLALAVMANVRNGYTNPVENGVQELLSRSQEQGGLVSWPVAQSSYFSSGEAVSALAIRALLEADAERTVIEQAARSLALSRNSEYWGNTFGTAMVVRALTEVHVQLGSESPTYSYSVKLGQEQLTAGRVSSGTQILPSISIPLEKITENSQVTVEQVGSGALFSTLVTKEFRTDRQLPPEENGLKVTREYQSERGWEYSLAKGDVVTVTLMVEGIPEDQDYLLIEDHLPSGLLFIDERRANEQYQNSRFYSHYGQTTSHEKTREGVLFATHRVGSREVIRYKARVIAEGEFFTPPASAHLMYAPSISGHSGASTLALEPQARVVRSRPVSEQVSQFLSQPPSTLQLIAAGVIGIGGLIALYFTRVVRPRRRAKKIAGEMGTRNQPNQEDQQQQQGQGHDPEQT